MEKKINIAELLKDCPKGMELDCTIFENVEFDHIDENNATYSIICRVKTEWGVYNVHTFTEHGCYSTEKYSKCAIFPKGKTTWDGFVPPCKFKDGDIVVTTLYNIALISNKNDDYYECHCLYIDNNLIVEKVTVSPSHLATEEEKAKLFQAIKANGYKWNPETKTLEKLVEPKFKVGDKIKWKGNHNYVYTITGIREKENKYECGVTFVLRFSEQDNWELVPNKFDIATLKPFDKVLVRDNNKQKWTIDYFSFADKEQVYPFVCVGHYVSQCIPYEGNECILGTTNDCDDFYKTWE